MKSMLTPFARVTTANGPYATGSGNPRTSVRKRAPAHRSGLATMVWFSSAMPHDATSTVVEVKRLAHPVFPRRSMPDPAVLLRSATLDGSVVDVLVADGVVAGIGSGLPAPAGAEVVDLDGRALLPGLWDAHVHFDQWTLARRRLDLGPAGSAAEATALVAARLQADPPEPGTALVGHGFRDALWPDAPHRDLLDPVTGDVPVVLVAADLHCCWLNSAAAARYGLADHPTGLVRERDWMPIMTDVRCGAGRAARPLVRRDGPGGGRARRGRDRRLRGAVAARRVGRRGSPTGRARCGWWRRCGPRRSTLRTGRSPAACAAATSCPATDGLLDDGPAQGRHRRLAEHPHGLLLTTPTPG